MCRLKNCSLGHKFGWRLAGISALMFFMLGAISFGYGIKLLEFAEKKDITPVFAAVPMLISGVLGVGVALSKKTCLVTWYGIISVIVLMLSVHMNYRFMVKEYSLIALYKNLCETESDLNNQHFCQQYTGTIMLCCVAVFMVPVAISAVFSCLVLKRLESLSLPWFTCAKVDPVENNRKIQTNTAQIQLESLTQSSRNVQEMSETDICEEFIPEIPNFMDLAVSNGASNAAFRASVVAYREEIKPGKSLKNPYSKSLNDLELSNPKEMSLGINRSKEVRNNFSISNDDLNKRTTPKKKLDKHVTNISNQVTSVSIQDFLLQKYHLENLECKENDSEDLTRQMILDNALSSRSRLYGVSDEETDEGSDSDLLNESKKKHLIFNQNKVVLRPTVGRDDYDLSESSASLLPTQTDIDKGYIHNVSQDDIQFGISRNSSTSSLDKPSYSEHNNITSPQPNNLSFSSERSIDASSEGKDLSDEQDEFGGQLSKEIIDTNTSPTTVAIVSQVMDNFSKDVTPPGLITPNHSGHSCPNGRLHFEFGKIPRGENGDHEDDVLPSGITQGARKNWIDFEGEDDKSKLIKRTMSESEYNDLTSYLM